MSEPVLNQFELLNWMYFKFFAGEILTVMSLIGMYYSVVVVGPGLHPIKAQEFFPNANSLWIPQNPLVVQPIRMGHSEMLMKCPGVIQGILIMTLPHLI